MAKEFKVGDSVVSAIEIDLPGTDKVLAAGTKGKIIKILPVKQRSTGDYVVEFESGTTCPVRENEIGPLSPVMKAEPDERPVEVIASRTTMKTDAGEKADDPPAPTDPLGQDIDETPMEVIASPPVTTDEPEKIPETSDPLGQDIDETLVDAVDKSALIEQLMFRIESLEKQLADALLALKKHEPESSEQPDAKGNGKAVTEGQIGVCVTHNLSEMEDRLNQGWFVHTAKISNTARVMALMIGPKRQKLDGHVTVSSAVIDDASVLPGTIQLESDSAIAEMTPEEMVAATAEMPVEEREATFSAYHKERMKKMAGGVVRGGR
jgi:hypothetical protein